MAPSYLHQQILFSIFKRSHFGPHPRALFSICVFQASCDCWKVWQIIQKIGALIFDQKWNWNVTWSGTLRASGIESGVGENFLYDSANSWFQDICMAVVWQPHFNDFICLVSSWTLQSRLEESNLHLQTSDSRTHQTSDLSLLCNCTTCKPRQQDQYQQPNGRTPNSSEITLDVYSNTDVILVFVSFCRYLYPFAKCCQVGTITWKNRNLSGIWEASPMIVHYTMDIKMQTSYTEGFLHFQNRL